MKSIPIIWTIWFISIYNVGLSQTACDTAIAGINMNMSLAASCRLDIDSSSASFLTSNFSSNLSYKVQVFDEDEQEVNRPLDPSDINSTFTVTLTGSGCPMGSAASAITWSTLLLEDKVAPVITCTDTTLSCVDFFFYKDAGGIIDECDLDRIQNLSLNFEPACDLPKIDSIATRINRTFRAVDRSGNADTCTQSIKIRRLKKSDILFPSDLTITCDTLDDVTDASGTLIAPSLALATGSGTLMNQYIFGVPTGSGASFYGNNFKECRVRAYYKDILTTKTPCTTTYQREWTVYEWYCDGEEVEHTRLQTITFRDTTPPNITFMQDTIRYTASDNTCTTSVPLAELMPTLITDNCSNEFTISAFSSVSGTVFEMDTITFPNADTIDVEFTVRDECGEEATATVVVITIDDSRPTAICKGSMQVSLSSVSGNTIPVSDFNVNSYDACGAVSIAAQKMGDTTFHTDHITFDCNDPDEVMVVLQVTDQQGKTSLCMTTVTLNKENINCSSVSNSSLYAVGGFIKYEDDMPASNINVGYNELSTTTNTDGYYEITDVVENDQLEIMPIKNNDHDMGVTTLDIILLQKHMLGLAELDSPYKIIAGDIDANGSINAIDLIELRKMILGQIDEFQYNTSFVFIPSATKFIDPYDPWENGDIFGKTVQMSEESQQVDFMGIKVGDVNNTIFNISTRSKQSIALNYEIIEMGDYIEVNIKAQNDISIEGFQASLSFDEEAYRFINMGRTILDLNSDNYSIEQLTEGLIPMSWNDYRSHDIQEGEVVIRMIFEKIFNSTIPFSISNDQMSSELYASNEIFQMTLQEEISQNGNEDFSIHQNIPNPWEMSTKIEFTIPQAAEVDINIYDASMRKVYDNTDHFGAGKNSFEVGYNDLPENGIFIYELIYGDQVRISKMTKL